MRKSTEQSPTVIHIVSQHSTPSIETSDQMKRLAVLVIFFIALSAGQVLRLPSSFKNGVKWEFGTNIFHGDVLSRSNVDQVPVVPNVYKKELVAPVARRESVVAAVYKNPPVVPDVYKKPVIPTVYKMEPIVHSIYKQQSVIPTVFKAHSAVSNIYKSEPVVHNVYKQQAIVPIVRKPHPTELNIYQFKSQPVQPVVHYEESSPLQNYVPKVLPVNSQKKVQNNAENYPHHAFVHGDVHIVSHN